MENNTVALLELLEDCSSGLEDTIVKNIYDLVNAGE